MADAITDAILGRRQGAQDYAIGSLEDDPEDAARALELSRATGIDPTVIRADVPTFEANHKASLTGELLRSNPHLTSYIDSDPFAAKVSNDDWGNLDTISQALGKIGPIGVMQEAVKGFKEKFGDPQLGAWMLQRPQDQAFVEENPLIANALAVLGAPIELPAKAIGGALGALNKGGIASLMQLGMDPYEAKRAMRDVTGMAEFQLQQTPGKGVGVPKIGEAFQQYVKAVEMSSPYVRAGKEPPVGLDPAIDKLVKEQSDRDLKNLAELTSEAQKSATRERSPELFERFIAQKNDTSIGIAADAVAELYGNKRPHAEDNLLGWAPDIERQMYLALASGGDIEIPLATWLARVEPEVAKQLHDHLRVRRSGLTKFEGDALQEAAKVQEQTKQDAIAKEAREELEFYQQREWALGQTLEREKAEQAAATAEGNYTLGRNIQDRINRAEEKLAQTKEKIASLGKAEGEMLSQQFSEGKAPSGFEMLQQVAEETTQEGIKQWIDQQRPKTFEDYAKQKTKGLSEQGVLDSDFLWAKARELSEQGLRIVDEEGKPVDLKNISFVDAYQRIAKIILKRDLSAEEIATAAAQNAQMQAQWQPITSVRTAAKLDPLFDIPEGWKNVETATDKPVREGEWVPLGKAVEAFAPEKLTEFENAIGDLVVAELERIVPKKVDVSVATDIRKIGGPEVGGVYTQFTGQAPMLVVALANQIDVPGIGRHEAIHHLRAYGFFSEAEWATLAKAAEEEGWISKERAGKGSSIADKYKRLAEDKEKLLEEAIADEFRYWNRNPGAETLAAKVFEKLKAFLESVKSAWDALATKNPEVNEIFKMIESGEIGRREGTKPRHPKAFDQFAEKDQTSSKLFDTIRGWMNKADQEHYMALIAERNAKDIEYQLKKAERLERKKQTDEWKQNETIVQAEVAADIYQRPDLATLNYLRTGELYGEATGTRPRVDPSLLTPEQQKLFPEKYQRRDGMDPQELAEMFGYSKFDDLAAKVAQLDQEIGNKTTGNFIQRIVAIETERRMVEKYGHLDENILREAQEHVIVSDTQMDLMHADLAAYAKAVGEQMPFDKAAIRRWAETTFAEAKASSVSIDTYLRDAGKAGIAVRRALFDDDPKLAFQHEQTHIRAMALAEQAVKFEKEQEQYQKRIVDRFSKRIVKGVDRGFTDWIQKLLLDSGEGGRRTVEELQQAVLRTGRGDLASFVEYHRDAGWELTVDTGLQEGRVKPVEQMTVQEFRDFKESLDSLAWVGKKVNTVLVGGKAMDFAEWRGEVIGNITQLPARDKNKPFKWRYAFDALLTKKEEIIKDLDLRQEFGPLFQAIIPGIADSNHTQLSMIEKLTRDLKTIKAERGKHWQRSLKDEIPNNWWIDPADGMLFDLNRGHLINIAANFGNRSNIDKFVKGYAGKDNAPAFEARIRQMFDQHLTPADLEYVQKMWDIWEEWRPQADKLYYELAGVPPKWIAPEPLTVNGVTIKGGYHPIIWDRLRSKNIYGEQPTDMGKGRYGTNYIRATPGNSYTKTRTGAVDAIEFFNPTDQVAMRMQQVIHDISFRETVVNVGKIIDDPQIRKAIEKHYGIEYADQLKPWVDRMANQFSMEEKTLSTVNTVLRRTRMAMLIDTLGGNLGVIASPSIGKFLGPAGIRYGLPLTEKRAANRLEIMGDPEKGIPGKSRELTHSFQNIDREYREALEATIRGNKYDEFQAAAIKFAFYPTVKIDQYFREITFYEEYTKHIREGKDEGQAIALADSSVRERHGSGADANLPKIMQGPEALKIATMFYGWFSTSYNWQRQVPGQVRRGIAEYGGMSPKAYTEAFSTAWFSVLAPALMFGWIFTERKEGENLLFGGAKNIVLQLAGTVPGIREISGKFIEGHGARSPWTALIDAGYSAYRDAHRKIEGKKVEKPFKHAANVIGLTAGLPLGQVGKTGQFIQDVTTGPSQKQPRNMWEWIRGIVWGEARLKKEKK